MANEQMLSTRCKFTQKANNKADSTHTGTPTYTQTLSLLYTQYLLYTFDSTYIDTYISDVLPAGSFTVHRQLYSVCGF